MTRFPQFSARLTLMAPLAALLFACGPPLDESEAFTASLSQDFAITAASMPSLGSAASFAVLGASTVTCTNASRVIGDVGVSPGTAITGFNPDCTITGTIHAGDAVATQAHNDLGTAYNGLSALACDYNLTGADLGGRTLAPGVYCFNSSVGLTGQLTLDAGGNSNAVWVFQIGSTITTATNASVVMAGSGQSGNVFWKVGSSATIGTGTAFQGNLLAYASITLVSGANLVGRALALNAAVTMDHNLVTLTPSAPPPIVSPVPSLGSAASFAVLGASTVTCTNASRVIGDVGVSPGTAITGFNPDCTITGTIHAGDAVATQAHNDLGTAYSGLSALACEYNLTGADLGGRTLAPGVYCFNSSVGLTGQLTLDAGGDSNAVWVFQIGSTITTATNASVVMAGSGQPCNVFWKVGSSATLGTGTAFQGNILAYASITLVSGSDLVGRALALNAAVTMDGNNVSKGNCAQ